VVVLIVECRRTMAHAHTHQRNEVDPRDFDVRLTDAFARESAGIIGDKWEVSRWQKHDNDRLYLENCDGYIDVDSGVVESSEDIEVSVKNVKGETWVVYKHQKYARTKTGGKFLAALKR